jgi:branched-chain amino acid transport system substrate-binding protein
MSMRYIGWVRGLLLCAALAFAALPLAGCGGGGGGGAAQTSAGTGAAQVAGDQAAPAGAADAGAGAPIKIGTSFPLTGTVAADGKYIVQSIQFAVDEVNAAGGINGRKVELVNEDDEADPSSAAAIANKFVEDDAILAVITSYNSSCCLAQIPVYKAAGLPSVSPVATSPDITGMSDYFYRTCASDAYVGRLGADYCKDLGWQKIALLYEQDDYGYGIDKEFEARAAEIGLEIAYVGTFVYGETKDFSTILTNVKNAGADGMFICGLVTETVLIANQAKTMGIGDVPICGADGLYSPALITEGGDSVEGVCTIGAFSADNPDPAVQAFVKAYEEKFGEVPSNWGALAYDAAMVVMEAMKSAGALDRESINEAIAATDLQGVTGRNKFVNSDVEKEYLHFVVKGGKWVINDV